MGLWPHNTAGASAHAFERTSPMVYMPGGLPRIQWAASNGALNGYGKASGMVTDRSEVSIKVGRLDEMSLEELEARIKRLDALEARIIEGEVVGLSDSETVESE